MAIVFYALVYLSTERYRVYSNDWLPAWHWVNFVLPEVVLKLVIGFGLVTGFSFMVLRAVTRGRAALALFLLLVPIFVFARAGIIRQRHIDRTASCANHSGVWWWVPELGDKASRPLPSSTEFADALEFLWEGENSRARNLHSATCPGFRLTGTKTGVVFVGGGLKLSSLKGGTLIAFCDWRCHPVPHDHLHAMVWNGEMLRRECMHNTNIVHAIERALKAEETGEVPYSSAAVDEMRAQLERRKAMAK